MNHEMFKLKTRRYIAWFFVAVVTLVLAFIAVYGALVDAVELVTLAGGGLLTLLGAVMTFFFSKKVSEE